MFFGSESRKRKFITVARGIRLANHDMLVFAVAGDGDCYGEGGIILFMP